MAEGKILGLFEGISGTSSWREGSHESEGAGDW